MQLRLLLCQFVCLSVYLRLLLKHFSIDISLSSLHVSRSYNFSPPFFAPSRMRNMWRPDSNAPKWDTSHNNNNNKHIPYFLCERERERFRQCVALARHCIDLLVAQTFRFWDVWIVCAFSCFLSVVSPVVSHFFLPSIIYYFSFVLFIDLVSTC